MPTFGLLHGAGLGAWCWEAVVAELASRGIRAIAVELPLSDAARGATDLVAIAVRALEGETDLIVVAHSISGLIAPLVAEATAAHGLILLHAALPTPGMSFAEQTRAEREMFPAEMLQVAPADWARAEVVRHFLFHDCADEVAQRAIERLRPAAGSQRTLVSEVTPLVRWPSLPCAAILCRDDRTIAPEWYRAALRQRLGIEPLEIEGGHCPMLARPRQLVECLLWCAASMGGTSLPSAS